MLWVFCGKCLFLDPSATHGDERPNVVLIMTDDQGYGDLGFTGNPVIRTPHLDRLARQSASMTSFYVSPVCTPTRASLMTGRYNYRTRAIDTFMGRAMMDPDEVTLAEILRSAGYATGIFGKWHLGDNFPLRAMDQGFEESLVHRGGGIGQPSDPPGGEGKYTDPVLFHNGRQVQASGYCTNVYFDAAIAWIDRCRREGRNFFAYLPTNAPHSPVHDVPPDRLAEYLETDLSDERFPQTEGHPLTGPADRDRLARTYAMISNIDENVGRLLDGLERSQLANNTIVIFMTDNGPDTSRYVAGMRGRKSDVYEGGIRTPFVMRWPSRLTAGAESDRIAAHIDVLPTLLDACEVPPPANLRLDGRSFLPLLVSAQSAWPERTLFFQSHRGDAPVRYHNMAVRTQRWKLVHGSGFSRERFDGAPRFELFDMHSDPLETHDVALDHESVVEQLRDEYDVWFEDVSATRPNNYDPPLIRVGSPHANPVVLTRQDWRTSADMPWGDSTSNGAWLLLAESAGPYDIRVMWKREADSPQKVELALGTDSKTSAVAPGARECTFRDVRLTPGPFVLRAVVGERESSQGPWHVEVVWRGGSGRP
jgi:arylsulfatase/arylsulfatase A